MIYAQQAYFLPTVYLLIRPPEAPHDRLAAGHRTTPSRSTMPAGPAPTRSGGQGWLKRIDNFRDGCHCACIPLTPGRRRPYGTLARQGSVQHRAQPLGLGSYAALSAETGGRGLNAIAPQAGQNFDRGKIPSAARGGDHPDPPGGQPPRGLMNGDSLTWARGFLLWTQSRSTNALSRYEHIGSFLGGPYWISGEPVAGVGPLARYVSNEGARPLFMARHTYACGRKLTRVTPV